jgi:hypothetical protein
MVRIDSVVCNVVRLTLGRVFDYELEHQFSSIERYIVYLLRKMDNVGQTSLNKYACFINGVSSMSYSEILVLLKLFDLNEEDLFRAAIILDGDKAIFKLKQYGEGVYSVE